ncbi:MAG TPA: M23 family metallopeptidase, partial [Gammaproteobacteria bacterium]|nr:M23 family metallopeptidase [Gammaproteobacteria bacterium]
ALARIDRESDNTGYAVAVRVLTSPLLAFPVEGFDTRAIQSGFGAERDGGARAHRGVDIFAPRGATAVAATDAWVVRVETTRVGGNVVWLQPLFGNMRLYYAHLDRQYVERGQFVLAGEPIGAVGNTGNAISTPPHLHFGVYVRKPGVRGGARDPYGFLR